MTIEWPPGCNPEKHFPLGKGPLNVSDPRNSSSFANAGGGANAIRKALNIPLYRRVDYTRASIEAEVREFFAKTGKRPTSKDLRNAESWLRARGSSVSQLCDELGLPGGYKKHTRASIEAEAREFFAKTGKRPTHKNLPCQDAWLLAQGSSLSKLCDEMGLPVAKVLNRTRASIEAEARKFFDDTGKRPTDRDLPGQHQWLRRQGSSLRQLCDELGLPGGRVLDRTRESIKAEVRKFFDDTGRRPSQLDLPDADGWLQRQGSSVSKLCDELRLPKAPRGRHAKPRTPKGTP